MRPTEDEEVATDGGAIRGDPDSPFYTVSDVEVTQSDRIRRWVDRSLATPFRVMWSDWRGKVGFSITLMFVLLGTVAPIFVEPPHSDVSNRLVAPWQQPLTFPLGTNIAGESLFSKVVHATPDMLRMVVAGAVFAMFVGAAIGIVSGYKGGMLNQVLMLITDTLRTLPGLPLVLVLTFIIQPSDPFVLGIILAINNWSGLARNVRSQILTLRDEEYVEASRTMGQSTFTIIKDDMLPQVMPYILIQFVFAARAIIFESVALYFLGIISSDKPNWGLMLQTAYNHQTSLYQLSDMHWILVPIVTIILFSFGMMMIAQSADRLFNPRVRARHSKSTSQAGDASSAMN